VLCRMGGVGTLVLVFLLFKVNIIRSMVSSYVCRDYMYMYTLLINIQCATLYKCRITKIPEPMYPHHPSYTTHARSRTHFTSYLPAVYNTRKSSMAAYKVFH
jgi:hypothetical protein